MLCVLAWEGGGRGELQRAVGRLAWTRRELMGPAAVDDEAKSCLPAASQAPQTAKQCSHPCHNSWVWLAQARGEALETQAGILFWQAASRSSSHNRPPATKPQPFLFVFLCPFLCLPSRPFCIFSLLLPPASPEIPLAALLRRSFCWPSANPCSEPKTGLVCLDPSRRPNGTRQNGRGRDT